jgi:hypothetical protein
MKPAFYHFKRKDAKDNPNEPQNTKNAFMGLLIDETIIIIGTNPNLHYRCQSYDCKDNWIQTALDETSISKDQLSMLKRINDSDMDHIKGFYATKYFTALYHSLIDLYSIEVNNQSPLTTSSSAGAQSSQIVLSFIN